VDEQQGLVWRDGELIPFEDATCHVLSHMAARGSQVFDVLVVVPTPELGPCAVGLRPHVTRFVHSAELMGMEDVPGVGQLEDAVADTVAANLAHLANGGGSNTATGPWTIKLIAAWTGLPNGLTPAELKPTVFVVMTPWAGEDGAVDGPRYLHDPVAVQSAEVAKIPPDVMPPSLKVGGGYTPGVRAHLQARAAGYDLTVLRTSGGDLAESTTSAMLVVNGGRIVAPPLDVVLDSITRRLVLDLAHHDAIPVDIRAVYWDEVEQADELWMSSTMMPIAPVARLDQRTLDAPGPITAKLGAAVTDLYRGDHPLATTWLTPVG
jgi:branched-chain amino acid aminotransferase